MKGACAECGRVRELRKVETADGKRHLCRACRKDLRREYPLGRQLEKILAPLGK